MKKVANLVFNPFVNDSRVIKESVSLARNGYDVTIIAHLNEGLEPFEDKGDYKVYRYAYLDREKTTGILGKLKAYLIYARKTIQHAKNFDYLHCNDLIALPIGVVVKVFYNKKIKIVYDAHEHETELNGLHGVKKKLVAFLEKHLIQYANEVITVSESIAADYEKRYAIPKPSVVLNTPTLCKVIKQDLFRQNLGITKAQKIFLYQGGLSKGRGIEMLVNVFKKVSNDMVIVFMGYGELDSFVKDVANQYANIFFHPAVKPDVLLNYTSSADYGFSLIEDTCLSYRYCLPNKMFEYIMAGVPPIVSNLPEMTKVIQNYKIGFVVKDNTEEAIYQFLMKTNLKDCNLERNLAAAQQVFNWEQQEKVLLDLYKSINISK